MCLSWDPRKVDRRLQSPKSRGLLEKEDMRIIKSSLSCLPIDYQGNFFVSLPKSMFSNTLVIRLGNILKASK